MKRVHRYVYPVLIAVIALLILVASTPTVPGTQAAPPSPEEMVQEAWRRAQETGTYAFASDIVQTTYPAPALANVGRGSRQNTIYLEGRTDRPARTLELTLWPAGSPDLNPNAGIEMRIEGDRAYGRLVGGEWEEVENLSSGFAPGGDPLAYLAGGKDYRQIGREVRDLPGGGQLAYTRYAFDLDGPAFAASFRDQLERTLHESGELPAGLTLDFSRHYLGLTGAGEVWVDQDGLPLRLSLHLVYPEQDSGERVEADIQTDFSGFDRAALSAAGAPERNPLQRLAGLLAGIRWPTEWPRLALQASLALGIIGFALLLVLHRSRKVRIAIITLLLFSMLVIPSLQTGQAVAFMDRQAARQAAQEEQAEQARAEEKHADSLTSSEWHPQVDPFLQAELRQAALAPTPSAAEAAGLGLPTTSWRVADDGEIPDPTSDADGDGLTLIEEVRLGTDPDDADSDDDMLQDDLEVHGFDLGGEHWYSDPLNDDSNNDGIPDTQECWTTLPGNLPSNTPCDRNSDADLPNADNIPDLFDRDNDNDGVDDRVDLSPFSRIGTSGSPLSRGNAFTFQVDGLEQEGGEPTPVFVDLQLRPKNPDHLTYALNVLDWPSGDVEGQVQRVLDTTFADSALMDMTPEQIETDPASANGDLRLIPMVEVTVPYQAGHTRNLPVKEGWSGTIKRKTPLEDWVDTGKLDDYGISVRYLDDQGTLGIYAPVNLVYDETGGARTAFAARLPYWPEDPADWGKAHQVRLVWVIQMLSDICVGVPEPPAGMPADLWTRTWCATPAYRQETLQIIQTYPDSWILTGFATREDHGVDAAIAFEDPEHDADPDLDSNLWLLAHGLDRTFMAARDANDNGKRDLTIAKIVNTFDNEHNSSIPPNAPRLWGIPKNALKVWSASFEHQDLLAQLPMTTTQEILQQYFTEPLVDHPTLLFAHEEHYRATNLDMSAEVMEQNGRRVKVHMAGISLDTLAAMHWHPYRYQDGEWEPYPLAEYWDQLELHLSELFPPDPDDPNSELVAQGKVVVSQVYYMSLVQGTTSVVQGDSTLYTNENAALGNVDLQDLAEEANGEGAVLTVLETLDTISRVIKAIVIFNPHQESVIGIVDILSDIASGFFLGRAAKDIGWGLRVGLRDACRTFGRMTLMEKASLGITIVKAVITISKVIVSAAAGVDLAPVTHVTNALTVVQKSFDLANTIYHIHKASSGVTGLANKMAAVGSNISKASAIVGVIGLIIAALINIGVFVAAIVTSGTRFGSLTFNAAFAHMLATIVVSALLLTISLIPIIGQIIAAIVGLIDALIALVCGLLPDEARESEAGQWICKGISGLMAQGVASVIYGSQVMVDLDEPDRLQLSAPVPTFRRAQDGFVTGNAMAFSLELTNTIDFVPAAERGNAYRGSPISWAYALEYTDGALKSSTFAYALSPYTLTLHEDLERGTMEEDWIAVEGDDDRPFYQVWDVSTEGPAVDLEEAGLNITVPLYLVESFAVPVQECWSASQIIGPLGMFLTACYRNTLQSTVNTDLGSRMQWDVFPASLNGFYTLAPKRGGYALAWGQDGDVTFPRLRDADGDGLPNDGSDPDDGDWDSDNDGLGDFFEVQQGMDPQDADMDGDGLDDRQELVYGTNPFRSDSDGDGLPDPEELAGWAFAYGVADEGTLLTTWVTADPLIADLDQDTLNDFQERTYHFHPRVASDPNVLNFNSEVLEYAGGVYTPTDGYLLPGQSLRYSATVENKLLLAYAQGLLQSEIPAPTLVGEVDPATFVLPPVAEQSIAGALSVDGGASSGAATLVQSAGAEITDPRAASNYAQLLLHFEDPATATTFLDSSGAIPAPEVYCQDPRCPERQAEGYYGKGVDFNASEQDEILVSLPSMDQAYAFSLWFRAASQPPSLGLLRRDGVTLRLKSGKVCVDAWGKGPRYPHFGVCTADSYANDTWHHLAHTFDGSALKIYVDGQLRAQTPAANLGIEQPSYLRIGFGSESYFDGNMDELAVYHRALSDEEVQGLYNRPVVLIHFDETSLRKRGNLGYFADASGFGNRGICRDGGNERRDCPVPGQNGPSRSAVKFEGDDLLIVGSDPSLDLSGGQYTMAFWVKPRNRSNLPSYNTYRQGIIGSHAVTKWAYPYVLREDDDLVAGFGTGGRLVEHTFPDVLSAGVWSYVVVTYETYDQDDDGVDDHGRFSLYVNGQPRGDHVVGGAYRPGMTYNYFDIGAASTCATLHYHGLYSLEDTNETYSDEFEVEFWDEYDYLDFSVYHGDVDQDEFHAADEEERYCSHYRIPKLKLWEDDGDGHEDDEHMGKFQIDHTFPSWNDQGQDRLSALGWVMSFHAHGGSIALKTRHENPSIPFYGLLDELALYKRALSAYEVEDLFGSQARVLSLHFDDPPGSYQLQDGVGGPPATCPANLDTCPTTGVAGRSGQAALFHRAEQDHLATQVQVDQSSDTSTGATFMAWVYPTSLSSGRHQVLSANDGGWDWSLLRQGDQWCVFTGGTINCPGAGVDLEQWQHVAAVFQPGTGIWLYKNGQRVNDSALPIRYDASSGQVAIGYNPAQVSQYFDGRIDEVEVHDRPLSAGQIRSAYEAPPELMLHLDEPVGASTFVDDSGNGYDAACWSKGPCAAIDLEQFTCHRQKEGWGEGKLGEFYIKLGGEQVWYQDNLFAGLSLPINESSTACAGDEIKVYEDDVWSKDDLLGKFAVNLSPGAYSHRFVGENDEATVDWTITGDTFTLDECPTAGTKGQVGRSPEFNGVDDALQTDLNIDQSSSSPGVTMMAWVYPAGDSPGRHHVISSNDGGSDWSLLRQGGEWTILTGEGRRRTGAPIQVGQWQHVAAVFDPAKGQTRFYLNGALVTSTLPIDYDTSDHDIAIGHNPNGGKHYWDGRIDEVQVYARALSTREIEDIFRYQGRWVEEYQTHELTVDDDAPTSALISETPYRANHDVYLRIATQDPTSPVSRAEWQVNGGGWMVAPPCTDVVEGAAYCPLFDPTELGGEGSYTLQTRATDKVGHVEVPTRTYTLYVDDTAPTVDTDIADGTFLAPIPHPTIPRARYVPLHGTASDPPIGAVPGSGVKEVRVTLLDAGGIEARGGQQLATLQGENWALDYLLESDDADGRYTVRVEAVDEVDNSASTDLITLLLDGSAPDARSVAPLAGGALCALPLDEPAGATAFTDVSGNAHHASCSGGTCPTAGAAGRFDQAAEFDGQDDVLTLDDTLDFAAGGYVLSAWFRSSTYQEQTLIGAAGTDGQVRLYLQGDGRVAFHHEAQGEGATAISAHAYTTGNWHHVAAVRYPAQLWLYVDGNIVAQSDGGGGTLTETLAVSLGHLQGQAGDYFAGTLDHVALYPFVLPTGAVRGLARYGPESDQVSGSASEFPLSFYNLLEMRLDEPAGAVIFADSSDYDHWGSCGGSFCPASVPGPFDQARQFDGADDRICIMPSSTLDPLTNDFTVMAWVRLDTLAGVQRIVAAARTASEDGFAFGTNGAGLRFSALGVGDYDTVSVTLQLDEWQHVAVAFKDGKATFYLDGVARETVTGTAAIVPNTDDALCLGASTVVGSGTPAQLLDGTLDEVRLFNQALSAAGVRSYAQERIAGVDALEIAFVPPAGLGSPFYNETLPQGTVLYLPLDASSGDPAGGEDTHFADLSTNALLATCSGTSCPQSGALGHTGRAVRFDGQQDYLALADHPALNLAGDFTLAAWVKRDPAGYWDLVYDSGSGPPDWLVSISPSGWLFFEAGWSRYRSNVKIPAGSWHHVAVVKSGSSLTLYRDAVAVGSHGLGFVPEPSGEKRVGHSTDGGNIYPFEGLIDELILLDRALSTKQIRALYLGSSPVLQLSFDQAWAEGGDALRDSSDWNRTAVLHGATGQHIVTGQVGLGALALDGSSDYATVEGTVDFARADYTVAGWFRTTAATRQMILAANNAADDRPGILLEVLADGRVRYLHRYPSGGSGGTAIVSTGAYNDGLWHLAVASKQGQEMLLYVDGQVVGSATDASHFNHALDVIVGRQGRTTAQRYFDGTLDEILLAPRALKALEVQALYDSHWRAVSLDDSGPDLLNSTWAYTIPSGLEGYYLVDLRTQDDLGNQSRAADGLERWNLPLDTLAPRLNMNQRIYRAGSTYAVKYTYAAQDFDLTEEGFHSPCRPAPNPTDFTAPWYRALAGGASTRLYTLDGSCRMYSVGRAGQLAGPGTMADVHVQDGLAYMVGYITNTGALRIVDVTRPWRPRQVGSDTATSHGTAAIFVAGDYAYVAEDELGTMGIIEISEPVAPRPLGVFTATGSMIHGLYVTDSYAYVANVDAGLRIVDVGDPANPSEVGSYDTPGDTQGVYVQGNYAYLAESYYPTGTLRVVDVSSPTNPVEVGALDTPGSAYRVYVSGTLAYVADGDAGLRIVDVSDPSNPQEVGFYDTPGWTFDVHVTDGYAYVSDAASGVWVLSVANPSNPHLVGRRDTPGSALGIHASGAYGYVADDTGGLQVIVNRIHGDELFACDSYGNCATLRPPTGLLSSIEEEAITGTLIVEPVSGTWISSTAPISASGGAYSPAFLQALTVTVDGGPIYTQTWGSPTLTDTFWTADWTPAGDGAHVITALLRDWGGTLYSDAVTVTLDTTPPTVALSTTVVTSSHAAIGQVLLEGTVDDNLGVGSVAVQVDGGAWWPASVVDDTWTALWGPDSATAPDGVSYTVAARATDLAGGTAVSSDAVLIDVAGPAPVTLTLAYQDQGGSTYPITRTGTTIRDLSPTLVLSWTASSDGSGLSGYRAGWTAVDLYTVTETLAPYAPSDPRHHSHQPGQAQKLTANLFGLDTYGNETWQSFGPIYVDQPLTPDYAALVDPEGVYRGWMDSGCTLLGVDRKVDLGAPERGAALGAAQRFYATWDAAALRLAWSGANWSTDGDLFLYLDTAPGGITVTLNPYTATLTNTVVYLPGNTPGLTGTTPMAADSLVWVQDAATALLLQWDGTDWVTDTVLTETAYLYTPGLDGGQTDLRLPFDWLGIADPAAASLDLVALASEEDALALWATMPPANPANSALVARGAESAEITTFALTQRYHWDSLGSGLCPNGTMGAGVAPSPDADLLWGLSVDPAGTTYAFLADDLFALWDVLFGGRPAEASSFFEARATSFPRLQDLQEVTYTLDYENLGTAPATGVTAHVRSAYALTLPDGVPLPPPEHGYSLTVPIGTVEPGAAGSVTFRGRVDLAWAQAAYSDCLPLYPTAPEVCEVYLGWAAAQVELVDDAHPPATPLEWLWADHQVDYQPPQFYGIVQPAYVLAALTNTLSGYAYEDAGIPLLTGEVQAPLSSATLSCPDDTPDDGAWSCTLDATAANGGVTPSDGDIFQLRLRGTDGHGQTGPWTPWRPFIVDTIPPTLTLAVEALTDLTGTVGVLAYRLSGEVFDNHGAAAVEVCLEEECQPAGTLLEPAPARAFEDFPDPGLPIDAACGCGTGAITRTFLVTESFAVGAVRLGLNAEHADRDQVRAELTSPAGTTVRLLGDDLLPGTRFQQIDVLLYDTAPAGLHAARQDDDPMGPFFDREARPYAPLAAFVGQDAAGTWTLILCDTNPAQDDGVYHLSHLVLEPLDTAPRSGPWWYTQTFPEEADGLTQTLALYGLDLAGNRSDPPLTLNFRLDNVPPVITVTAALAQVSYAGIVTPTPVLTGTVYDGGGVRTMYAIVQDPEGSLRRERVALIDGDWFYPFQPTVPGRYLIWVTAEDGAGNGTRVGPAALEVMEPVHIYLPVASKQWSPPPPVPHGIYLPMIVKGWSVSEVERPISGLDANSSSPTVLGQATAFTATVAAGTNVAYDWAFGDGAVGRGDTVTHTYTATGVYTPVVTASNSVSLVTATTAARVVPTEEPIAGLSLSNDSPTPLGDATTFTATVSAGTNVAYDWAFGDGAGSFTLIRSTAGERVVYHLYGQPGTYTAVVTASNSVSLVTATTAVTVTTAVAGRGTRPFVAGLPIRVVGPALARRVLAER